MNISRRARLVAAIGAIALVPAALTACSGGGQSVADACELANDDLTEMAGDMSGLVGMVTEGDIDGLATLIDDVNSTLSDTSDKLENDEVKAAFDDLSTTYSGLTDALSTITDNPASKEAQSVVADMQTQLAEMSEAQTALTELCTS